MRHIRDVEIVGYVVDLINMLVHVFVIFSIERDVLQLGENVTFQFKVCCCYNCGLYKSLPGIIPHSTFVFPMGMFAMSTISSSGSGSLSSSNSGVFG